MIEKNKLYTVEISDINNLGYGVCRIGNIVTFVSGGVTGDVLEVKVIKVTKSYAVARIEKILTPSRHRIESPCSISNRCGGCIYQNITYEHEKDIKRSYVLNAFKKVGLNPAVANVVSDNVTDSYRNKVQYPVGEGYKIGYYAPKSHDIIECDCCALQSEVFNDVLKVVSDFIKNKKLNVVKHIYLRHAKGSDEVMLCLVTKRATLPGKGELVRTIREHFPFVTSIIQNINPEDTNVILGDKNITLYGKDYIEDILCGLRFRISALSFYQVNHDMAELLYQKAAELADVKTGEKVIDLFCGTGTIGLFLASRAPGCELVGIEIVPDAVENAKVNADINNIKNAKFICGDANSPEITEADVIILDPPRKGCSRELVERLCQVSPKRIVYVSCDPDTLARDCAIFKEGGYTIGEVTPFDLFPRTGHVETVALITRV